MPKHVSRRQYVVHLNGSFTFETRGTEGDLSLCQSMSEGFMGIRMKLCNFVAKRH